MTTTFMRRVARLFRCDLQAWMFSVSGEKLTARLRRMAFEAMLRQVCCFAVHSLSALTSRPYPTILYGIFGYAGIHKFLGVEG